jgi:predicted PurR-regulated permease PerM
MLWTIAILFVAAILLLIISFVKTSQSAKTVENQIDSVSFAFKDEIYKLQQQIKNVELDAEITAQEAGVSTTSSDRNLLKEFLSLYKRGYSVDSIAEKTQQPRDDVQRLLAPYIKTKDEGSANVQ